MSQPPVFILGGAQTDFARNWSKENKHIVALMREATVGHWKPPESSRARCRPPTWATSRPNFTLARAISGRL